MDLNARSRIFIDVASRLILLSKAKRLGRRTMNVSELLALSKEAWKKGKCLMFKPYEVGGYVLACNGEVVAIATRNPPRLGEKALEFVDDNPFTGDLYEIDKDVVESAVAKLTASERASKAGEAVGKAMNFMKSKMAEKKIEETIKEEEKEVEKIIERLSVPELEIFDLIDTITLSDEMAYYMEKKGYTVSAEPPEEVNGHYFAVLKVEDVTGDIRKLMSDIMDVAEKCDARSLIKVIYGEKVYYVDPIFFKSIKHLADRLMIDLAYVYIVPKGDVAELHVVLNSDTTTISMSKFIELLRKLIKKRKLPWGRVKVVIETPTNVFQSP